MIRILVVCLCCVLVAGCGDGGPTTADVSGVVTMDGSPMADVTVTFVPDGGGTAASGKTDASGKYTLNVLGKPGATLGPHTVKVTATQAATADGPPPAVSSDSPQYQSGGQDYASGSAAAAVKQTIPEKYNTKSELQYEVVGGDNTFNIDMTSK